MRILKRFTAFAFIFALLACSVATAQNKPATTLCPLSAGAALADITASGATQVIAVPTATSVPIYSGATSLGSQSGTRIIICRVDLVVQQGGTLANFGLVSGTGTNCGTGQANLTPQWYGTASVIDKYQALFGSQPLLVPVGKAVCVKFSTAPTKAQVHIVYGIVSSS